MTSRIPAGVFECRTWIVEVAKSKSPQRRAASSWTRRPEKTSVAMTGRRSSISQPRGGVELGGRVEHRGDLSCRLEMRRRRSLDLDPAASSHRRVVVDPPVFDREGEEPTEHLDGLVDRSGRERSKRATERVGARPAFGEATAAVIGFLELVEPVGVDGPDVDLRQRPVREEGEQMSECPIPILGGRRPDFASALLDLRCGERSERRGVVTAIAITEGRPMPPVVAAPRYRARLPRGSHPSLLRRASGSSPRPVCPASDIAAYRRRGTSGRTLLCRHMAALGHCFRTFLPRSAPSGRTATSAGNCVTPIRFKPNGIRPLRSGPIGR
jgi:hypothetical protein